MCIINHLAECDRYKWLNRFDSSCHFLYSKKTVCIMEGESWGSQLWSGDYICRKKNLVIKDPGDRGRGQGTLHIRGGSSQP